MRNIIKDIKIRKELKKFKKFKDTYQFNQLEIVDNGDCKMICDKLLQDNTMSDPIADTDMWVDVGYKYHCQIAKVLSNLFPYTFYFRGHTLHSIECFFQGLKFRNPRTQRRVFEMSGVAAYNIRAAQDYDWRDNGTVYWAGKPIRRESTEYQDLIDELYISVLLNPLFASALHNVGDRYILHSMGEPDPTKTTFTRYEYERQLNTLRAYQRSLEK